MTAKIPYITGMAEHGAISISGFFSHDDVNYAHHHKLREVAGE